MLCPHCSTYLTSPSLRAAVFFRPAPPPFYLFIYYFLPGILGPRVTGFPFYSCISMEKTRGSVDHLESIYTSEYASAGCPG